MKSKMVRCYGVTWYEETKARIVTLTGRLFSEKDRFLNTRPVSGDRTMHRRYEQDVLTAYEHNMHHLASVQHKLEALYTRDRPDPGVERQIDDVIKFVERQLDRRVPTHIWYEYRSR